MKCQTLDQVRERLNAMLHEKTRASGMRNVVDDFDIKQIDERTVRVFVFCKDASQLAVDFDPFTAVTLADSDLLLHVDCGSVEH